MFVLTMSIHKNVQPTSSSKAGCVQLIPDDKTIELSDDESTFVPVENASASNGGKCDNSVNIKSSRAQTLNVELFHHLHNFLWKKTGTNLSQIQNVITVLYLIYQVPSPPELIPVNALIVALYFIRRESKLWINFLKKTAWTNEENLTVLQIKFRALTKSMIALQPTHQHMMPVWNVFQTFLEIIHALPKSISEYSLNYAITLKPDETDTSVMYVSSDDFKTLLNLLNTWPNKLINIPVKTKISCVSSPSITTMSTSCTPAVSPINRVGARSCTPVSNSESSEDDDFEDEFTRLTSTYNFV
jgi:hypothetical protein